MVEQIKLVLEQLDDLLGELNMVGATIDGIAGQIDAGQSADNLHEAANYVIGARAILLDCCREAGFVQIVQP